MSSISRQVKRQELKKYIKKNRELSKAKNPGKKVKDIKFSTFWKMYQKKINAENE